MRLCTRVSKLEKKFTKPNQRVRLVFLNHGETLGSSTYSDNANTPSPEEKIIVVKFVKPSPRNSDN